MFPINPRTLDSFWPCRASRGFVCSLPNAELGYQVGNPGEQIRYEADCAAGKPNRYGPNDIEYRYNSQGFRCIEFDRIPTDSFVVLSLGDSNAEGYGVPVEHTWSQLLCGGCDPWSTRRYAISISA
ncbi:hypothetical protein BH11PSE3_BH11PSE3_10120 [soil metagenome]